MSVCAHSQPVITCRCCGQPTDTKYQPGLGSKPAYWLITCWNTDCALHAYTYGSPDYQSLDLTPYLEKNAQ